MQIHFNTAFEGMPIDKLDEWIKFNRERLIGSCIFTANNKIVSKVVGWAESWSCEDKAFIPTHVGSIIEHDGELYLFNMKPPFANMILLDEYIMNTDDTFALVLRDFTLDTAMFSANIYEHLGEFYPFLSAIRSVFTKRNSKWRRHCSELHLRELQKQNIYKNLNSEITPDELWHEMRGSNG